MWSYLFPFLQGLFVTSAWRYKRKNRERRLFIVPTEPRQRRHGLASGALFTLWHVICHCSQTHTCTHSYTLIYSKSASPHRWNCFQGKGGKKFSSCSFHGKNKVKPGGGQCCVSIDSPLESGEMLSHHRADKSWGKFNYISVKCERFFFQSESLSMPVWTFTFNLFPDIGPLWRWCGPLEINQTSWQCQSRSISRWA